MSRHSSGGSSPESSVRIVAHVVPNARRTLVRPMDAPGHWKVFVQAPPVRGKATAAVIAAVAAHWGVPRAAVEVIAGATARQKMIRIHGPAR